MESDVLIVGQGLAGSTLAWRLADRGVAVGVVDRGGVDAQGRLSASRVAAGLITPVTGKRLTVADDYDALLASAVAFYRGVERETGAHLLTRSPAVRVFVDEDERRRFDARLADPRFAKHARLAEPSEAPALLPAPWGAMAMPNAARLWVVEYLTVTRTWLAGRGRFQSLNVDRETEFEKLRERCRVLVLCQGYTAEPPRWTAEVELQAAKGEVLTIDQEGLPADRVVHRGLWIAPDETRVPGRYRVGATHDWERLDSEPTDGAREFLLERLAEAGARDPRVVNHQAAVRPAAPGQRPTYGFSDEDPRIGWLTGLGSKGSLWAPFYAERMAELVVQSLA